MSAPSVTRARGGGTELGYAAITSDFSSTTSSGIGAAVTGLSVTVTVGSRPIMVEFNCDQLYNATAAKACLAHITEDNIAALARIATGTGGGANEAFPGGSRKVRLAPSPGSHTYSIYLATTAAGTAHIYAAAGNAAFIQVVEI